MTHEQGADMKDERPQAFCAPQRFSIWRWLGYGHGGRPDMSDLDDAPGFAPGYITTETFIALDWRDRLRVLASGRLQCIVSVKTERDAGKTIGRSAVGILAPKEQP